MATIPIFDGTNYEFWSVEMRTLFLSKGLWDTVQNGPGDEQQDAKALSHIQQGVSDRIFRRIRDATEAKRAWDILSQLSTEDRIPIFDGTNYEFWRVKMRTLFLSKGLWDTVQDGFDHEANQQNDTAALSDIQQGVSDGIYPEIEDATTAKQAWDILFRFSTEGPTLRGPTLPDLTERAASHLIVATLVATVAFTAGFTMPGGYNSNDGLNQGMAILTRKAAFKAFMVTDTIAMSLSISAVLIHFYATMPGNDSHLYGRQVYRAALLIIFAVVAMVLAFVTGTYAVLAHSSGLAISVCVIGCLPLFFFLIIRIIENVRGSDMD